MKDRLNFETENLLDRNEGGKKKTLTLKFKFVATFTILVIIFMGYRALRKDIDILSGSTSLQGHELYNHMKSTISTDQMALYHTQMRVLIHTGTLQEFNKYEVMVKNAKNKSTEVGNQIQKANTVSNQLSDMIKSLSNPASAIKNLGGLFNLKQEEYNHHHNSVTIHHNFNFDVQSIIKSVDEAKTTQKNVNLFC